MTRWLSDIAARERLDKLDPEGRLAELAKAATPGPWWGDPPYGWGVFRDAPTHEQRLWLFDRKDGTPADAAYIAAASPDVILALLAENRRLSDTLWAMQQKLLAAGPGDTTP